MGHARPLSCMHAWGDHGNTMIAFEVHLRRVSEAKRREATFEGGTIPSIRKATQEPSYHDAQGLFQRFKLE